ncbi:helix-turn-helix domain-containing protein, partial [Klebsiella pneumoniae]
TAAAQWCGRLWRLAMGNKYTVPLNVGAIRESCFRPADKWTPPTGDELRYLLENVLNLSQEGLARHVGVNGRTVRRWVNGESDIAYSVWCILCIDAGLPPIWK